MKVRWFQLEGLEGSARAIAEGMRKASSDETISGRFRLEFADGKRIMGRFVDVAEWEEEIVLPAGGLRKLQRVEVRETEYLLHLDTAWLQLTNPSRTLRSFWEAFRAAAGRGAGVSHHGPELQAWLQALESRCGRVRVTSIATGRTPLSASASASFTLRGERDVRRHLSKLPNGKAVPWGRVGFVLADAFATECEIVAGGRASLSTESTEACDLLREALIEAATAQGHER